MADDLTPIEERLRQGEVLDNAERTRLRFTFGGQPLIAISVDVTIAGWDVDAILARRLDSRRSYAVARAGDLLSEEFLLMPTFTAPHYSLALPSYTREAAAKVIEAFGDVKPNPHYKPRRGS